MPYTIFVYSVVLILLWLAALCCYYYFPKKIACLTIGFGLGFAWVSLIANIELHQQLPAPLENHPLMITGNIVSLPEIQNDHCRFLFAVDSVCEKQHCHAWHGYVLLRWYYPQQWVHAGERWQFTTRLLRPHSLRNEGNLDYVAWLFSRHIHATGYVYNKKQRQFIEKKMRYAPLATLREKFLEKINLTLQPGSLRGFIKSLVVGDRSELQAHDWDIFRLTGTNHLVVIAGLHIGLLLQVFRMILSLTWRIKPTILLSIPAPMLSGAAGVLLAWSYSLLAGFSIPTQRACWMLCAFLLTLLLRRKVPTWYSFSCAIFLILLFDPLAVIDSSFWLSFNAVGSLAIGMQAHSNHFRQFFSAQWVLMVGMLPLMLWLFQQISFVAWIANMLVIPIVGFLVVPLCLFGGLFSFIHSSIAALLWHLAEKLLLLTFWILEHLAHLPIASWQHGVPYLALLIPGYIGAFLVLKAQKST